MQKFRVNLIFRSVSSTASMSMISGFQDFETEGIYNPTYEHHLLTNSAYNPAEDCFGTKGIYNPTYQQSSQVSDELVER